MLDSAEYVGTLRDLAGKTALIQRHPSDESKLLAQFDGNEDWRVREEYKLKHPVTNANLCLGWHEFPVTDFKIKILIHAH